VNRPWLRAFFCGVLVANSVPHIGSGVTGHHHLTPVRGRRSGPVTNLVWGLGNATAGYLLLWTTHGGRPRRWDDSLVAFEAGAAAWALWSVGSERAMRTNWSLTPLRLADQPPATQSRP
jgi:hypothetical protein